MNMAADTMTDEQFEQAWKERSDLLHVVFVSYRYHRKRQRFFDFIDKGTKALTVLAGASLLADYVKAKLPAAALIISGLGLLSLVYGYSDRKQAHKELSEAWIRLAADIEAVGRTTFTRQHLSKWESDRLNLDSREPPPLHVLTTLCENEQAIAAGHPERATPVPFYQRLLANWVSFA